AALTEGAGVRTAPSARCELRLADGSQVRLNEATEARLVGGPAVELKRGQVWSAVPQDSQPLRVTVPGGQVAARGSTVIAVMPPGARADFSCSGGAAVLTAVHGSAKVIDQRGG